MQFFKDLNQSLIQALRTLVTDVVPGGNFDGNEYKSSSIYGGPGDSFSINLNTGKWADFAVSDHKGGDLISLYSKIHNITQYEAAVHLADRIGYPLPTRETHDKPSFIHAKHGKPELIHEYRDRTNRIQGYVIRYKTPDGKTFSQFHIDEHGKLIPKAIPNDRPLYNLPEILRNPTKPVLICEGEKSADAATKIAGKIYVTTTSIGGSSAPKKTNWNELANRDVLIWPDNDEPGIKYARQVAEILVPIVKSLKIIRVDKNQNLPIKFDAADALDDSWDYSFFLKWARDNLDQLKPIKAEVTSPLPAMVIPEVSPFPDVISAPVLPTINISESAEIDPYSASRAAPIWQDLRLQMNNNHTAPNSNMFNVYQILTKHVFYAGKFKRDTFTHNRFIGQELFSEEYELKLLREIQGLFMLPKVTRTHISEALDLMYMEYTFNSAKDWLTSLAWDKTPRINNFFSDYYGAESYNDKISEYLTQTSSNFWIAMVNRIMNPGCKFDNVVVLEGDQGILKTTSLQIIGSKFFGRAIIAPGDKDNTMKFRGKFLVELAEMRAAYGITDEQAKAFLDEQEDEMRDPYARSIKKNPRSFVFVGTTNDDAYLKDPTGSRRWWPIKATAINIEKLTSDRDQLFAEAIARINEPYWIVNKEQHEYVTSLRQSYHEDAWTFKIMEWVMYEDNFHTNDILTYCLNFTQDKIKPTDSSRITKILKSMGWNNKPVWFNGSTKRMWTKEGHKPLVRPKIDPFPANSYPY